MAFKKDLTVWNKLKKDFNRQPQTNIDVGWFNEYYGPENDNLPVATVAAWMEHGHPRDYPPRPFIREGFIPRLRGKEYSGIFTKIATNILTGQGSVLTQANVLGVLMVKGLQNEIIAWDTPPNSIDTIRQKGFDDPLIETGKMLESVEYRIRRGGTE